jgi:hypothetical protein
VSWWFGPSGHTPSKSPVSTGAPVTAGTAGSHAARDKARHHQLRFQFFT